MGIYERYAEVYDRVGQPGFSLTMADFTLDLLKKLELLHTFGRGFAEPDPESERLVYVAAQGESAG